MREAPGRPYVCDTCGKQYSQPQGVSRHRKRAHNNPHSCFDLRCKFKWSRPCQYGAHLRRRHRDVDSDFVLGKPTGSRRSSTIIGRDLVQRFYPPPAIEPDRRSRAELRQRPTTPLLPAVANVTHVLSPATSPVAYDLWPECAEPAVTMRYHEVPRGSEVLGATETPASTSTEERALYPFSMDNFGWRILLRDQYAFSDLCFQVTASPHPRADLQLPTDPPAR
jgi:hypothetical protein